VADGVDGAAIGGTWSCTGAGACSDTAEQAASAPRIAGHHHLDSIDMWVILLEALGALVLLVLIVWWTMFSGRNGGERRPPDDTD
jgi:hypothetical protein